MIKVQIVDDSAVVRQLLQKHLGEAPGICVIGASRDPIFAMREMEKQWPDVVILDIEMPRMDGITFLKKIMATRPTPVIICSSLTERGAETTIQALAAGAVDIITKPQMGLKDFLIQAGAQLIQAVKAASKAKVRGLAASSPSSSPVIPKQSADVMLSKEFKAVALSKTTDKVVAIGTSTGGTQALEVVLTHLPRTAPGIVIVQHMPEHFTAAFASRLNQICQIQVREAQSGDRVLPGLALIANGGKHMLLKRSGAQYTVEIKDGPLVSRHKPSVDVLFRSVAKAAGANAIGIIMTGMGDDGVTGLKEMLEAGATTYAQDEASCVVYGMPKEAVKRQAARHQISLTDIRQLIVDYSTS